MVKRVCLVSGGTGGHLLPAVVLARAMADAGHAPVVLTEGRDAERALLQRFDCAQETLPMSGRGLAAPVSMLRATVRARRYLRDHGVELVVGTGGRATVPVALAARSLGVPLALMEQNAVAGRANRLLARWASRVYLGLPTRRAPVGSVLTGTPVREDLGCVDRSDARAALGLDADLPVVMVTGGSQGAEALNETVPAALCGLHQPLQVLHLCGPDREEEVRLRYAKGEPNGLTAIVRAYAYDMSLYFAAANLVICRGGGGTVAELAAAGRGAVIIPYPHHRDRQQFENARVLAEVGAAEVIDQHDLTVAGLRETVTAALRDERWRAMGEAAQRVAARDSCDRIMADLQDMAALD